MIPPLDNEEDDHHFTDDYKALVVFNFILIFFIVLKLQYYFRLSPTFGLLTHLIVKCIGSVMPFLIFMFLWIYAFSAMFYVLGSYSKVA